MGEAQGWARVSLWGMKTGAHVYKQDGRERCRQECDQDLQGAPGRGSGQSGAGKGGLSFAEGWQDSPTTAFKSCLSRGALQALFWRRGNKSPPTVSTSPVLPGPGPQ